MMWAPAEPSFVNYMNMGYTFMKNAHWRLWVANLHIKGIDEETYVYIKKMAAAENRSVSQQILFLVKKYLAARGGRHPEKTAAQTLLELSGSWDDDRPAEAIISEIKMGRRNMKARSKGIF